MNIKIINIVFILFFAGAISAQSGEKIIYNFENGVIPPNTELLNSSSSIVKNEANSYLIVKRNKHGQNVGISFIAEDKDLWNFSGYAELKIDVTNYSENIVTVWSLIEGYAKSKPQKIVQSRVPAAVTLAPGKKGVISLYVHAFGKKLSKEYTIISGRGLPVGSGELETTKVKKIKIFVKKSVNGVKFGIDNIRLFGDVEVVNTDRFFPFIDSFGQYKYDNWQGKTKSEDELKNFAVSEKKHLENVIVSDNFDAYGGWKAGGVFNATGYFRVQKINSKWWIIDPEGHKFFSHGVNGVGQTAPTPTDYRENYFDDLPSKTGEFASCWSLGRWAPHGFYKNNIPFNQYDFFKTNLIKKYGKDWKEEYREITYLRFKYWGINTLGNWSSNYMVGENSRRKIPYVVSGTSDGSKVIEGSRGWWRKFPDPFDETFKQSVRKSLNKYSDNAAKDPYCIGFFVDNEQSWGDELSLSIATLKSPSTQAAKIALVNNLKNKYERIEKLNSSWNSKYNSWEDLQNTSLIPDVNNSNVKVDLIEFYKLLTKEYFQICREEVKRIAPHHMYLGCRFSAEMMDNDILQHLSEKFCDIITYNIYNLLPVGFTENMDKPVIIGEFHFGALDRGMFHTGLWYAKDQNERAKLYYNFVNYALENSLIVGTHWFKYPPEPTLGRSDGENFQIGFTDICDKPYPELIEAIKKISSKMYQIKNGKI